MKRRICFVTFLALLAALTGITRAAQLEVSPQQRRGAGDGGKIYRSKVEAHWFGNNTRFWYRNDLRGGAKEFIVVDAEKGSRQRAFDHQKLAVALSSAVGKEFVADKLPFDSFEFIEGGKAMRLKLDDANWKCDLTSYKCSKTEQNTSAAESDEGSSAA